MSWLGKRGYGGTSSRVGKVVRTSVAVVAASALVLGISLAAVGCGDESSGPEETVQKWLTAMGDLDFEAMIELTHSPQELAALEEQGVTMDDLKYAPTAEMVRSMGSMEFSDITMESKVDGDEAVVTITGGSVTIAGMGVTLDVETAQDAGLPAELDLYKVDGKWYIDLEE